MLVERETALEWIIRIPIPTLGLGLLTDARKWLQLSTSWWMTAAVRFLSFSACGMSGRTAGLGGEPTTRPSSLYALGQEAKETLEKARGEIASVINADPQEIIITSGGSEADNQALRSAALAGRKKGKTHLISTAL